MFDEQVTKVLNLIDRQLTSAQNGFPEEQIESITSHICFAALTLDAQSYLILSGGLGSSMYLRKLARERYQDASQYKIARQMKMIVVDEP